MPSQSQSAVVVLSKIFTSYGSTRIVTGLPELIAVNVQVEQPSQVVLKAPDDSRDGYTEHLTTQGARESAVTKCPYRRDDLCAI